MAAAAAAAFHHSILRIRIRIRGVRYRQYSCYGIRGIRNSGQFRVYRNKGLVL